MKCKSCGTDIEETWSFCPRCGAKKGREFGRGIEDLMELFERSVKGIFSGDFPTNFPFGKGFMVEISQEGGSPRVSVKELGEESPGEKEKSEKVREIPKGSEVVEPKVAVKSGKDIEIQLPGVKSEGDIYVKRFHDSLEIRAFGDTKVYFVILPNIKTPNVKKNFENGVLTLKLS